jgi:two-component system cell cycle response regulator
MDQPRPKREDPIMDLLIAEDDVPVAELLRRLFQMSGFTVRVATDGRETLTAIADRRPDLLILDLMMPELDGWEVLRKVKSDPATECVKIAIYTALVDPAVESLAKDMGAEDFWVKAKLSGEELVSRACRLAA